MKRFLYNILPNALKKKFKLKYYNFKNQRYTFGLEQDFYTTSLGEMWTVKTINPLYFIVSDIDRYENYYHIKKSDVVLDCGANEGALSVVYSKKVGETGKVYGFEPDSINIKLLNKTISLNNAWNNFKLIEKAIWKNNETIEFFEEGTVASSAFYNSENSKKVLIKAITIDRFLKEENLKQLDFIKMDIEGAEIEALEGGIETIEKHQPNFAIASYHLINGEQTYIALETFFKKINYPFKTVFFDDGEAITYAGNCLNNK